MSDYITGILIGFILGTILLVASLSDWERIEKSKNGWFISHEGKIYKLEEVK